MKNLTKKELNDKYGCQFCKHAEYSENGNVFRIPSRCYREGCRYKDILDNYGLYQDSPFFDVSDILCEEA